jgi:phosphatidylinositol phospholipase C delta
LFSRLDLRGADVDQVPIEAVKEIRTGDDTDYYRIQFKQPEDLKDRWITVIYILDGTYKTLHLIAESRDTCKLWTDTLGKLITIRQGLISGSVNFSIRQSVWERQYFKGADKSGDQVLDLDEIKQLSRRLSANLTESELEKMFKVSFLYAICRVLFTSAAS